MSINVGKAVGYLDLDTSGFKSGFASALNDLKVFKSQTASASQKIKGLSSAMGSVGRTMTKNVTVPIVAAGAAAVTVGAKFDSAMSRVKSVTGATAEQFTSLRDKAMEMGANTKFSASEAADALYYMGLAGWDTEESIAGLDGVMSLAAASGEDLASVSDIVTDAMTAFGLAADETTDGINNVTMFSDVLAQTSRKSNTDVSQLGEAFKNTAAIAGSLSYSVQDVSTVLGVFANNGTKGAEAGTMLKTIIRQLISPTDDQAKMIKKLGISMFDSEGNARDLMDVIHQLKTATSGYTEEQKANVAATLGGARGMTGLAEIMNTTTDDIDALSTAIKGAGGASEEMASTQLDNLKGQLTILTSTLETIAINFSDVLTPAVENIVGKLQELATWISNLNTEQLTAVAQIAATVAAIGPALLIGSKIVAMIGTVVGAFESVGAALVAVKGLIMGTTTLAAGAGATISAAFLPITAIILAVIVVVKLFKKAWDADLGGIQEKTKAVTDKIKEFFGKAVDFIKDIPNKVKSGLNKFGELMKSTAQDAAKKFMNFLKDLPYNLGVLVGKMLAAIVKFSINFIANAIKAGKGFKDKFSEFIQKVPGVIADFVKSAIKKIGEFVSEFPEKAKEAAKNFSDKFKETMNELPDKLKEIGGQIIDGLIKGITGSFSKAVKAVKDFSSGVVDGFKSAFDIHSPSKIAEKQIGEQVANGVIKGINNRKDAAKKSAAEMSQIILDAAEKRLDKYKTYHDMSVAEEAAYWDKIRKQLKKGTDARLEADKKYLTAKKQISADLLSTAQKELDNYKVYHDMSVKEEAKYWNKIRKQFKKGTEERISADQKYFEAKKEVNEQLLALDEQYASDVQSIYDDLTNDIDELNQKYEESVTSRTNAILSSFSLFDEYNKKTETTAQTLIDSLQSQVTALSNWETQLDALESRGILPDDMVSEIRGMGVDASGEIEALNTMTDEQLTAYAALYAEKNRLAKEQAIKELEPLKTETALQIEALKVTSQKKLNEVQKAYVSSLTTLGVSGKAAANKAGKNTVAGLITGITSKKSELSTTLNTMLTMVLNTVASINAAVASAGSAASSVSSKNSTTGKSHSAGLSRVPYNDYIATLHEGEQVLTKSQADDYRSSSNGKGDTFNFYGTPPLNERETARQMKKAKMEQALGF